MQVIGDRQVCIGAGNCVFAAPDVFDQDEDDALVLVLQDEPGEDQHEAVEKAAAICPSGAVRIG